MLKKIALRFCDRIRRDLRDELQSFKAELHKELDLREQLVCQNIELARHHISLNSTAEYVNKNLAKATSFPSKFELLTSALSKARKDDGLHCEFGVFNGGTINHIAGIVKTPVYGFDSFEGLPEGWNSLDKGHFAVAQLPQVPPHVTLIKGWFNDTLPKFVAEHPGNATFLHIDCDLYSSTKFVFETLARQIVPGTVIAFDEYFNYPNWEQGEYLAFQEFIKSSGLGYEYIGYNRFNEQVAVIIRDRG